MRTFKKRFVDYLKLKTTKEIFLEDISFEEKKEKWIKEIAQIHECFDFIT